MQAAAVAVQAQQVVQVLVVLLETQEQQELQIRVQAAVQEITSQAQVAQAVQVM
jgi:hypothetical protein